MLQRDGSTDSSGLHEEGSYAATHRLTDAFLAAVQ